MEPIKFRYVCWNKHFKELSLEYLTDDLLRERMHVPSWILSDNCEIIAKQLGTGKIDINGKEIYDGDVVKRKSGEIYKVVHFQEYARFQLEHVRVLWWVDFMELSAYKEDVEIIGNVYMNPELIPAKTVTD